MNYRKQIENFVPHGRVEHRNHQAIMEYIDHYGDQLLRRECTLTHLTSSGLIMNPAMDKTLMVHHNIYDTWAWTGGHADGDMDMQYIAIKEAIEETGIANIRSISQDILSLDILPVYHHEKNGRVVPTHLHLSVAYVLLVEETEQTAIQPTENSGVQWIEVHHLNEMCSEPHMVELYQKLIARAQSAEFVNVDQ